MRRCSIRTDAFQVTGKSVEVYFASSLALIPMSDNLMAAFTDYIFPYPASLGYKGPDLKQIQPTHCRPAMGNQSAIR